MLMSTGAFLIAASSLGIQAFNNCTDYKSKEPKRFKALVTFLVFAILSTLLSFGGMYAGAVKPSLP